MVQKKITYHIVGDGIAGLMLAWALHKAKQDFIVYASPEKKTASAVAGGLINPITGMRFVKTWLADELFPCAEKTYREIENELNVSFFHPIQILRIAESIASLNDWQARAQSESFKNYVVAEVNTERSRSATDIEDLLSKIPNAVGAVRIRGAAKIETNILLNELRDFFAQEKKLIRKDVNANDFSENEMVIFCEGKYASENALFANLPLKLVKGHYLVCDIPDLKIDFVLHGKATVIPQPDGLYRIGSTYQWDFDDDKIEETQVIELTQMLRETIRLPFEIKDVLVGIRPASPDRRPILGSHPEFPNRHIFNGLGTKGFSLAPYFAAVLCEHLVNGKEISKEVSVRRFQNSKKD